MLSLFDRQTGGAAKRPKLSVLWESPDESDEENVELLQVEEDPENLVYMIELEKPAEKKNPRSILLMENESDSSEKVSKSFNADDLNKKVSLNGFLQGDHMQVY